MLEIKDLSFRYTDGEEDIFSSLSLSVNKGEIVLILAPPGSGKTTLARILTGGAPKYTGGDISGSITINGIEILDLDIQERQRLVGRISQNTDEMILFSTVKSELEFPFENLGLEEDEIERKVDDTLSLFELEKYRNVSTTELSGGEKRRLMSAILFSVSPEVLVLDESFDELSPRWRARLAEIVKKSGKTILLLGSHALPEYDSLYDRVLTIKNGKIEEYTKEEVHPLEQRGNIEDECLSVEGIHITRKHRSILDEKPFCIDIPSFSIHKGECVVLMGENGCGKSTFSKILCGLLNQDRGEVKLNGNSLSDRTRRVKIAYLMQNPFEQLFLPTVYDELKSTDASTGDIENALELFSLDKSWYVSELSYGKAKLVQAAVFYLLDRDYAILDELDSAMSYEDSLKVVSSYMKKNRGLIIITHDEKFASLLPFGRYYIKDGTICK